MAQDRKDRIGIRSGIGIRIAQHCIASIGQRSSGVAVAAVAQDRIG